MPQAVPFLSPELTPFDYIILGGFQSPGYAELVGVSAPRRLRVMEGMGWSDSLVAFGGFLTQKFSVKLHLYNDKDWADWLIFSNILAKKITVGKSQTTNQDVARPMDIYHPFLADQTVGIHSVIIEDVVAPVPDGDTGGWLVELKMVSYNNPKVAYAKEEGSKEAPMDARDRQIAANQDAIAQREATIAALKNQNVPAPKIK